MTDTETLISSPDSPQVDQQQSDFPSMGMDLLKRVNFKVAFFLLLVGVFIFSDFFLDNALSNKYQEAGCANSQGTMVQLVWFVLAYIAIDLFVQGGIL
jgi:hypothetical protein